MFNEICPICNKGLLIPTFENKIVVDKCPNCGHIRHKEPSAEYRNYEWLREVYANTRKSLIEDGDKIIVVSYLKNIRENRGISQKQIAEILGFTEQRYGNIERHYNAPAVILIAHIAHILDVNVGELYKPVRVKKEVYDDMQFIKIDKGELVPFNELIKCSEELKKISDKNSSEYVAKFKEYNDLVNNNATSMFLKLGELVENVYWERYLEIRGVKIENNNII